MAEVPFIYKKLPGRGSSAMEYHRLYLGPDHLLLVASTGFSESYRRFYFRDIQAIVLRKTVVGLVQTVVLGLFTLGCLGGLLSGNPFTTGWLIGWSIPLGFFLALFLFNLVRGPTCVCDLQTAVQTRRVGCINRLGTARKLIERLRPLIEGAQTPIPPDELRQRLDAARQAATFAPPVIGGMR